MTKDLVINGLSGIDTINFPRLVIVRGSLEATGSSVSHYSFPRLGTVEGSLTFGEANTLQRTSSAGSLRKRISVGQVDDGKQAPRQLAKSFLVDLSSLLGVCTREPGSKAALESSGGVFVMCPTFVNGTLCQGGFAQPPAVVPPVWGCVSVAN